MSNYYDTSYDTDLIAALLKIIANHLENLVELAGVIGANPAGTTSSSCC